MRTTEKLQVKPLGADAAPRAREIIFISLSKKAISRVSYVSRDGLVSRFIDFSYDVAGLPMIEVDDPDRSTFSNLARSNTEDYEDRSRSAMLDIREHTTKTEAQSMEEMVQDMQGKYLRVMTRKCLCEVSEELPLRKYTKGQQLREQQNVYKSRPAALF